MENSMTIPNDKTLDGMLELAASLCAPRICSPTAETFVLAAVTVVLGHTPSPVDDREKEMILKVLEKVVPIEEETLKKLAAALKEYAENGDQASLFFDQMNMDTRISAARRNAESQHEETLKPHTLLDAILRAPTRVLINCVNFVKQGAKKEDEAPKISFEKKSGEEEADSDEISEKLKPEEAVNPGGIKPEIAQLMKKIKSVRGRILKKVIGQDSAVNAFLTGYFQARLNSMIVTDTDKPAGIFVFAGPAGVGKTLLAQTSIKALGLHFKRFDMSEYSDYQSHTALFGYDKNYKSPTPGLLTDFVKRHPNCAVLFDEIEKAHSNVINLFLQILDTGILRDAFSNENVSFKNVIIIFTTNAGRPLYEGGDMRNFSNVPRKVVLKALRDDVRPDSKVPYFPAAICSRFSTGGVVMFNHMAAHDLKQIVTNVLNKHVDSFEKESGITVRIDERVYTTILLAEGGTADARAVTARAETFLDDEFYELFRMISAGSSTGLENLKSINFKLALPEDNEEISGLFKRGEDPGILLFANEKTAEECRKKCGKAKFYATSSIEEAKKILRKASIDFVLISMEEWKRSDSDRLNVEDVLCDARDFFWYVRSEMDAMPVFLLENGDAVLKDEEIYSFKRVGARGSVRLDDKERPFALVVDEIADRLNQQRSMEKLARANKLISYETAQTLENNGQDAVITLFDLELVTAVDADDAGSILSKVSMPDVTFSQVIGAEDAKNELKYFVEYLKNPKKYVGTGVSVPKGVLFYGPPGTGKTMLAKAMAHESGVTFIAAEGNQFHKSLQGQGPALVHELFRVARKYAPSILFVDEVDAIAMERRGGTNDTETEAVLTAFLAEMDGFKNDSTKPVFVLAATNVDVTPGAPGRTLDAAILRRFDRRLFIDLPNRAERERFLRERFEKKPIFKVSSEMLANVAMRSTGMSLALIDSVLELSMRMAVREGLTEVDDKLLEEAFETFNGGEEKKWDPETLERTARHEAGHTLISYLCGERPSYVTIVARGNAGGYMQFGDREDKPLSTKDELLGRIRATLGGRAAEIVCYGERLGISTGASGDLAQATELARRFICTYGMDENVGQAVIASGSVGGRIEEQIFAEINAILERELQNAIKQITEHRNALDALVEKLISDNHLTGDEISAILSEKV